LLRLFRSKTLQVLLFKIAGVVLGMQSFAMILFLYLFIVALIGMQFFANRFRFDDGGDPALPITSDEWIFAPDRPRSNFDSFTQSFVTVFQLVTIDNWNTVMFDCQRALGGAAGLFPVMVIMSGSFVTMSMFLAILIHNFTKEDPSDDELEGMMGDDATDVTMLASEEMSHAAALRSLGSSESSVGPIDVDGVIILGSQGVRRGSDGSEESGFGSTAPFDDSDFDGLGLSARSDKEQKRQRLARQQSLRPKTYLERAISGVSDSYHTFMAKSFEAEEYLKMKFLLLVPG
jgi:uncharacterized membrane protein